MRTDGPEPMMSRLQRLEKELRALLDDEPGWKATAITFRSELTHRVERKWEDCTIRLHRFFPRSRHEDIIHPHDWAGAFRIVKGGYDMIYGWAVRPNHTAEDPPPYIGSCTFTAGSAYSMEDARLWHSLQPQVETWTVCLMGPTFQSPDVEAVLHAYKVNREAVRGSLSMRPMLLWEKQAHLDIYKPFYPAA